MSENNGSNQSLGITNIAVVDGGKKPAYKPTATSANHKMDSNGQRRMSNVELRDEIGLFEFEARYVRRPDDDIVIAVAMISSHCDLEARELQMALAWLDIWDDGSFEFKMLKKKGLDLSGM